MASWLIMPGEALLKLQRVLSYAGRSHRQQLPQSQRHVAFCQRTFPRFPSIECIPDFRSKSMRVALQKKEHWFFLSRDAGLRESSLKTEKETNLAKKAILAA